MIQSNNQAKKCSVLFITFRIERTAEHSGSIHASCLPSWVRIWLKLEPTKTLPVMIGGSLNRCLQRKVLILKKVYTTQMDLLFFGLIFHRSLIKQMYS